MTAAQVHIERLDDTHGSRLRTIRLRALRDAPDAFGATLDEALARPLDDWGSQLERLPTFIATVDGRDVGLVRGAPHGEATNIGYLISLWVAPEARRNGIASALVDKVIAWAKEQAFHRLMLDVSEHNRAAIALYTSKGFAPNGESDTLPPPREHIREIQMERVL